MKINLPKIYLVIAIGLSGASAVYAHEDYSEGATYHWLNHTAQFKEISSSNQSAPYGYATKKAADREITISNDSPFLNVTRLETVKINIAGKSVVWNFDTVGTGAFPLAKVLQGADGVMVYVAENPSYQGN